MALSIGILALLILLACTLAWLFIRRVRPFAGHKPDDLGIRHGLLKAPMKDWHNVVSSQAAYHPHDPHHLIEPIEYTGNGDAAMARLTSIVRTLPRTTVIASSPHYLHAECNSLLLGFVDDLEFMLDKHERLIHMRSGARLNRQDFGINRTRLETIRRHFERRATSRSSPVTA